MPVLPLRRILALLAVAVIGLGLHPVSALAVGQPAFNIDAWTIDPGTLERGADFDLTLTFSNVGTFGANEVLVEIDNNEQFTGLGTGPRFHHMGIGQTATATLRVAISPEIETGYYGIPIRFSWHHEMLGEERLSEVREIGVSVDGLSPFRDEQDTGKPQLVIEQSSIEPGADGILIVTLFIRNIGNRSATNVVVNLVAAEEPVFVPAEGASSAFGLDGDIDLDQVRTITLPLRLVSTSEQTAIQEFRLDYASYSGGDFSDNQSIPIVLSGGTGRFPRLLIEKYTTDLEPLSPGTRFRLTLDLVNVGGGDARDVFIRLGKDAESLDALTPTNGSNLLYVAGIPAGARTPVSYDMVVDGAAESSNVALDVTLEYANQFGATQEETVTISLQILSAPTFSVNLLEAVPQPLTVGQSLELPLEIINIGSSRVNVSTVAAESDILMVENGSAYVGPLDAGTSGTINPVITASQAGTATLLVTVNYLDSFQQPQTYSERLVFVVEEGVFLEDGTGAAPGDESGASPVLPQVSEGPGLAVPETQYTAGQRLVRGLLGFLGLGTRPAMPIFMPGGPS